MFPVWKWLPGTAGALALIFSSVSGSASASARAAEGQGPEKAAPRVKTIVRAEHAHDPAARALLDRVSKAYRGLTSYSDQGEFVLAVTLNGKAQKQAQPLKLALARPNRFVLDAGAVRLASDGKTLTTVVGPLKKYTTAPAPESVRFETFREGPAGAVLFGGPTALPMVVLLNLITGTPPEALIDQIGGTIQPAPAAAAPGQAPASALVIAMKQGPDVLLEVDPKTSLLSSIELKIDAEELARSAPPGQKLTIERFGWRAGTVSTKADRPGAFAPEVPQGFAKVDSFQGPAGGDPEYAVQKKLDKPAPDFSLTLLDGKDKTRTVSRDELKGKVVLIDFWATWCGPCLKELPEIQKLIESYARSKKGVLIVALSQDDEPEELSEVRALVEKTLKAKSIDLTAGPAGRIGLDPSGSVGKAFDVEGFPTLVLIDARGTVRSVHVGFDPDAEEPLHKALAREIDALLEGKPLPSSKGHGAERPEKTATP